METGKKPRHFGGTYNEGVTLKKGSDVNTFIDWSDADDLIDRPRARLE